MDTRQASSRARDSEAAFWPDAEKHAAPNHKNSSHPGALWKRAGSVTGLPPDLPEFISVAGILDI
jgi:hypothetical protein